nr:MAG TPA: hypothetical protein [Caudoviricetes sp.]
MILTTSNSGHAVTSTDFESKEKELAVSISKLFQVDIASE